MSSPWYPIWFPTLHKTMIAQREKVNETKHLHIQHDPYITRVALFHKSVKILGSPKVMIYVVEVLLPVTVITFLSLLRYR